MTIETYGLRVQNLGGGETAYEDESTRLDVTQRAALIHKTGKGWSLHTSMAFPYHDDCESSAAKAKRLEILEQGRVLIEAVQGEELTQELADGLRAVNRGVLAYREAIHRKALGRSF